MAKITKLHKYSAHWLNHMGYTNEQISDEIQLSIKQISNILSLDEKTEDESPTSDITTTPKHMLITHTSGKKLNTVAIMTKEASSLGDESIKTNAPSSGRDHSKNIFRPNK